MGELLDDLSRIVASGLPRRRALGLLLGAVAGAALGGRRVEPARAKRGKGVKCGKVHCKEEQDCCDPATGTCCDRDVIGTSSCCGKACCAGGLFCCDRQTGPCCKFVEDCCPGFDACCPSDTRTCLTDGTCC